MYLYDWNNVTESFRKQLKSFTDSIKLIEQSAKVFIENINEKTKPVRAFYILAEHQFTYGKLLYKDEAEKLVAADDVDDYLAEKIEDKSFIDYDVLYDRIIQSQLLLDANKSMLNQTIEAINNGLYDLALVGVITVFDCVLSAATKDDSTHLKTRLNKIRKQMDDLSEEQWESLTEKDMSVFGMYITWTESIKGFQKRSDFNKPESEPAELNRHWIAHGRKTSMASKLDCCKMVNLLYGLIYFGDVA